ncbi:helix-turn-helix domain-containing protein [Arcticibacter tournemirensis]|uniref:XRE family transcriptional regulator n=1 Tax=Arcticibacter tournemirensis TaxID=699437 RepID=A0A4Q0M4M5_9SPHI|nr:helix-turn-helix transcriptional regulator [Arcticibacter tournemirensis]RXF67723.1 XRE family transcriptional regulator [Arcticibacter tournemirensis]
MAIDKEEFKRKLGRRIEQLRTKSGLTLEQLGSLLDGKDRQFINRYEKYGANPTAYILVQIAEALNVSVDQLIDFSQLED